MDGTITGLGDFDQCLEINSPSGYGQYCLFELFFKNMTKSVDGDRIDEYLTEVLPIVNYFNPRIALCLPSKCSQNELVQFVDQRE